MRSPGSSHPPPIGVILAGGAGRRIGGAKASVRLLGRPLITYPLTTLRAVLAEVVVQAKPDTALPELSGAAVWTEPARPRHPLFAIVHALERSGPRPVLVCAADMPLVTPALIARLAGAPGGVAIVAAAGGRAHPLLGLYRPAAHAGLHAALCADPDTSLTAAVQALDPVLLAADPEELLNVNTRQDLRRAEQRLTAQPNVKS